MTAAGDEQGSIGDTFSLCTSIMSIHTGYRTITRKNRYDALATYRPGSYGLRGSTENYMRIVGKFEFERKQNIDINNMAIILILCNIEKNPRESLVFS